MATLTEVAYYTRKSLLYGGIGLVSLLILRFSWGKFAVWWSKNNPPSPPPATVKFGTLPPLSFPEKKTSRPINFQLQTISGTTPDLGSQAKVYFVPLFRANVFGLELATGMAIKLGFLFAPARIDEQVYEWTREGELPGTLNVELITGYFTLTTEWYRDAEITTARAPSESEAVKTARTYLRNSNLLPSDLETGSTEVDYLAAGTNEFTSVVSQSDANFARVHLFRADLDGIPALTPNPDQALVQVTVSGASRAKQVVELLYRYSPVEIEQSATYPLRTTQEAWQQLQAHQGYIAKIISGTVNTTVRNVTLGYYDSLTPQEFMQPIYVFEGDHDFVGYVPAISQKWLNQ